MAITKGFMKLWDPMELDPEFHIWEIWFIDDDAAVEQGVEIDVLPADAEEVCFHTKLETCKICEGDNDEHGN